MLSTLNCFAHETKTPAVIISAVLENNFELFFKKQSPFIQNWLTAHHFSAKPETVCLIPDEITGNIKTVLVGIQEPSHLLYMGYLAENLPEGIYALDTSEPWTEKDISLAAIFWGMGAYQFTRYKKPKRNPAKLLLNKNVPLHLLTSLYLIRDLINTPTEDMGTENLALAAKTIADNYGAKFTQIVGDELLVQNYPAIHAVGRASADLPRLIDIQWGEAHHPKVTLIGKGVCFDSGGLDLKPASGMLQMKKDMAGAAHVLGLANSIMAEKLPIRLRVLIPAVQNSVSGNAYRPGDIIKTRKGLTVEIGNTDAEGRVILADAITEAVSESPELLIDFATLTGAARIALGPEISALFSNNSVLAQTLINLGNELRDPIWELPLYKPYRKLLDSPIADINNASPSPYGGALTAALFLSDFIGDNKISWAHFDIMAWNVRATPAHPEGAEAMGFRAVFEYLHNRYTHTRP